MDDEPIRWSMVAGRNGLEMTADTDYPEIALLPATADGSPMRGVAGPDEGTLPLEDTSALIDVLRNHTRDVDRCWFCLWDGYGWDTAASYSSTAALLGDQTAPPVGSADPVPDAVRNGPRVSLPSRSYFLYQGDLADALAFVDSEQQTPKLWWPQDRSWCVATEIDLPWTYVGGSDELIRSIVEDSRLEAWPVRPTDSPWQRIPTWLDEDIDVAVALLLGGHSATVTTALGSVRARIRLPARLRRHGDLWLSTERSDGASEGSSGCRLTTPGLREQVRHQLQRGVIDLLG
ncbi:hypothetical protein [Leekyejoonella antrihumi]|uniref:Uncharacterized protein n=1 Tax=Leekyejoonella antrihumi TaxID=1660198 RepID=A0A563E7X2_9MICO|nr:hypothetical protein [Leekyejoonella antrihumi]TWP38343.1 hypothetical protein FGL98_03805 [Leekyejoonella antrihumi]